jgi:formylglycine-generating enzyme required for sulfatase activity
VKVRVISAILFAISSTAQAAFVTIGDPGNAARPSGYGAVDYTYQISEYEVTIAEFSAFTDATGVGGNENYWNNGTPHMVGTNAPAGNVSLYEAMKYCNWLTSGNVNNGAYQFSGTNYLGTDRAAAVSTYAKIYALPTFSEWYKAAYYNVNGGFWSLYANGTDTAPALPESRYGMSSPWCVGSGAMEQNGTYDMMGNNYEWTEMVVAMDTVAPLCGGYYDSLSSGLSSSNCLNKIPETDVICVGFRIVAIPEPATALLFGLGGMGAWLVRRNKKLTTGQAGA